MTDDGPDHHADADAHHLEAHHDIAAARAAVTAAALAVAAADTKMDGVIAMLGRHFRLGLAAISAAVLIGGTMLYLVLEMRQQAERTEIQAVANEVEVLRHRVHSKESDLRLCTVALGATRGIQEAERICAPVVGPDFMATKALLAAEEARLARLRAAAK